VLQKLLDLYGFLRFVLRRWSEDRCPQIAASLTYTTLLALVPVFAIAVAMLSSLPFFEDLMVRLKIALLLNLVPEIAGKIITEYMEPFSRNAAKVTGISFAALFVMAIGVMWAVDRSLNAIWRVRRSRPFLISLAAYVILLSVGPILVGISVTVTTYLMTLSVGMDALPREAQPVMLKIVPVGVSTIAFFLAYRIVPHRQVPWAHALLGGFVAALLFEGMKEVFAHYIAKAPTYNLVYGAFAAVPLFLVWVYLSWLVILFGAEVTVAAGYWRGNLWQRVSTPGARFRDAVELGRLLVEAKGEPLALESMCQGAAIPRDQLEDALGHLIDSGLVRRVTSSSYALARPPSEVTLGDLYRAVVAPGARLEPEDWSGYSAEVKEVIGQFEALLNRPLTGLMEKK
jgi:membrane protein